MRYIWWTFCGLFALVTVGLVIVMSPGSLRVNRTIVDVSWPNCTYIPNDVFEMGIIGVTGGLDFRPNLCLTKEAGWFLHYAAYMNTGYPGGVRGTTFRSAPFICSPVQRLCLAYNYGFHAAQYALQYAALQRVHAGMWWLDVETENSWTADTQANSASLAGSLAAIRQETFANVGFYSTPHQWEIITGSWRNGLPAWQGTGETSRQASLSACKPPSFTGGPTWLSQYTLLLDENVPCSTAFMHSVGDAYNL